MTTLGDGKIVVRSGLHSCYLLYVASEEAGSVAGDHVADVIKDLKDSEVDSLRRVFHALKIEPCRLHFVSTSPVITGKNNKSIVVVKKADRAAY